MEAAEKLDRALECTRTARDEAGLEEAAVALAACVTLIGIPAFLAVIWRGSNRFTSANKTQGVR